MDFASKKVPELKRIAKDLGYNVSRMTKAKLIEAIEKSQTADKQQKTPPRAKEGTGLSSTKQRVRELNPDLYEKVKDDLHTIPDVRPFRASLVMKTDWDPWDELVFEYEAFATRAGVFGSSEANFLAYVNRSVFYNYIPTPVSPYVKPEEFVKQKQDVHASLSSETLNELYNSYPLIIWIYISDNKYLGSDLIAIPEMLYIASCMGKDHPYSIIEAMKEIKNRGREVPIEEHKMKLVGEIGYFSWETINPLHKQIAELVFGEEKTIKRYESIEDFKKLFIHPHANLDRLISEYLKQPAVINNKPLYIQLAGEMKNPHFHIGAYRYTAPIGIEPLKPNFMRGWNTEAALFFLMDPVVNNGQIESREIHDSVFGVLMREPISSDEIKTFVRSLGSQAPELVDELIRTISGTVTSLHGTWENTCRGGTWENIEANNIISIFEALLGLVSATDLKRLFEAAVRAFEKKNKLPVSLRTILLWDKLKANVTSPAFFETVMADLREQDFATAMRLPLMKEKKVIRVINKGFGKARETPILVKLLYKVATRSVREKRWDAAYSQLRALVPLFAEIPETHLWILMLSPRIPVVGDYGREDVNPFVQKAFEELGVAAVLDIYIQLEVLEGIQLAFARGATTETINSLMLPGKKPEIMMFLRAKQEAGK